MKKNILACAFILSLYSVYSQQESQFTQYMYNTKNINPAYVGSREVVSFYGMYRAQWVGLDGAPNTGVFSFDSPVYDRVGLGLTVSKDEIGISDQSFIAIDFSYSIPVFLNEKKYTLAFGLRTMADLLSLDYGKLRLENPGDPVLDPSNNLKNQFAFNVGTGVYFYSDEFYVGFSVPEMLESEYYDDDILATKAKGRVHGYLISGYVFDNFFHEDVKFKPATLIKAVSGAPIQVDLTANFMFQEKFVVGISYRVSSAFSGLAGFQINNNLFVGYAYDFETTKLARYNSGSHEIFLRYELNKKSNTKNIISPRFF